MLHPIEIHDVLSPSAISMARALLDKVGWEAGTATAGPIAAEVKHNLQAKEHDTGGLRAEMRAAILRNELFNASVLPQQIGLMFSRYDEGAHYGTHIDDAMMGSCRRDISFTLFLSEPEDYLGGELVIEQGLNSEARSKLGAGSMIVYPATSLHRVTQVTQGSRLVVVGWARSYVRDAAQRELLFELAGVRSLLYTEQGKTASVDLLSKCLANLRRMWIDD